MTFLEYKNKYSGEGIKKCPCWECLVSEEELVKKREEFWNTRVEGDTQVWNTIKAVIEEPNLQQAEQYIKAAGLKLASGNLLQVLDSNNIPYLIPVYVIHDPVAYKNDKQAELPQNFQHTDLSLTIRPMGNYKDKTIKINSSATVGDLKEQYTDGTEFKPENLRLFFGGRELKDAESLAAAKLITDVVIQGSFRQVSITQEVSQLLNQCTALVE